MRNLWIVRLASLGVFCCLILYIPVHAQTPQVLIPTDSIPQLQIDTTVKQVLIADVAVEGYKQTKPYIIQREVPFKKGAEILRAELPALIELCRQQLMNTTLFVEVEVKPVYITSDIVIINIHVKERWYLFPLPYFKMVDRNFNTWWVENKRSLQRINYGLKFAHNNVSGRNDKLNIWLVSGYTQQASIRYENPFLDKSLKHGMNVGFSYSRNREINYATIVNKQSFFKNEKQFLVKDIHVDLAYTYRPAVKTRHNVRVSYSDKQVNDTVLKLNPNYLPGSQNQIRFFDASYSVQYFNVDYIPYPLKGFWGEGQLYQRFGRRNSLSQISGRGTFTTKVFPKTYVQFQAAGVLRVPFKQSYINTRFFGSSDFYMRGLEYYVIDGVAGGLARATIIQKALQFNIPTIVKIKTISKIPVKFYLKAFGDMGYSYSANPGSSLLNNKVLRSWGVGLDVLTIYDIVFKLEYSFNQLGDRGLYVHSKSDF